MSRKTVHVGMAHLETMGLLQTRTRRKPNQYGGYPEDYRLSVRLYKSDDEPFARLAAHLLYGGTWRMLPTHASRHLYIAIAGLDPIRDEDAYEQAAEGEYDLNESIAIADEQRARHGVPASHLMALTGLSRYALFDALHVLRTEVPGGSALVRTGLCNDGRIAWYATDPRVNGWSWNYDVLNDLEAIRQVREKCWPPRLER